MDRVRMVRLTTLSSSFEAKVVAARLGTEGVVCELRGGVDGPYPIGHVHLYVEEPQLDTARDLLAEVEPLEADAGDELLARALRRPMSPWLAAGILAALLALAGLSVARVVGGSSPDPAPPAEQPEPSAP